jgi:hypothetical protein
MKSITVSIPGDVYRAAELRAVEDGSSVSALVSDYLHSFIESRAEFSRLETQQRQILDEVDRFRAADRMDREELHRRA